MGIVMNVDPLPWLHPNAEPNVAIAAILRAAFEPQREIPGSVMDLLDQLDSLDRSRDLPHRRRH